MEKWHIDPTTGLMVCEINGMYMLSAPGRGTVEVYGPFEVEHIVMCGNGGFSSNLVSA